MMRRGEDSDADPSTVPQDDIELPNNDFCFTEDDFLQSFTVMNDTTRHRGFCHNSWKKIRELDGKEVTCRNTKDGKVV